MNKPLTIVSGTHYLYGQPKILITGGELWAQTDINSVCEIEARGDAVVNATSGCIVEAYDTCTVYAFINSVVYVHSEGVTIHKPMPRYGLPGSKKTPNYPARVIYSAG